MKKYLVSLLCLATTFAYAEDVDKIIKKMHISPEKACQILDESYERYLEIKEQYTEKP